MAGGASIKAVGGDIQFSPSPINPAWILEGTPVARNALLSFSPDGSASTLFWDCTAGRFNWYYTADETVCVLEGGVTIKEPSGTIHRLGAGDTIYFPAGTHAEWIVDHYIRKVAFCRTPLPGPVDFAKRVLRRLKRLVGRDKSDAAAPPMFGG
jgi:uncharacterized cupin superfamily protein